MSSLRGTASADIIQGDAKSEDTRLIALQRPHQFVLNNSRQNWRPYLCIYLFIFRLAFVVLSYARVPLSYARHVRLSHACIDSKLKTIGSCVFHHQIAKGL